MKYNEISDELKDN